MPKWWFAATKYVIWPGSHCSCICKPAHTIACAFVYSSRLPVYASIHCGCPPQEQLAQSFLTALNRTVFLHEGYWLVSHIILLYYLVFWSQEQMNIIFLHTWDALNPELGHPKDLFKAYLAERFENFSGRVFSQQKTCFLKKLNYCEKPVHFFCLQWEEYFRQSLSFLKY